MEIDLDQVIVNLLADGLDRKELLYKFNIIGNDMSDLSRLYNIGNKLLDYHFERVPELHTQQLLLNKGLGAMGRTVVGTHKEAKRT